MLPNHLLVLMLQHHQQQQVLMWLQRLCGCQPVAAWLLHGFLTTAAWVSPAYTNVAATSLVDGPSSLLLQMRLLLVVCSSASRKDAGAVAMAAQGGL